MLDRVGLDDGDPVLPLGAVHLGGRAPGLGCHVQDVGCMTLPGDGADEFVLVTGIGRADVTVERGFIAGGRENRGAGQSGEKNSTQMGHGRSQNSAKSDRRLTQPSRLFFGWAVCMPSFRLGDRLPCEPQIGRDRQFKQVAPEEPRRKKHYLEVLTPVTRSWSQALGDQYSLA